MNNVGGGVLFARSPRGEWKYPLGEYVPGVFVEECARGEQLQLLTEQELRAGLLPTLGRCAWHGIGYETGRAYYQASFEADVFDYGVLSLAKWELGRPAGPESKPWAVEFSTPGQPGFVRRCFWYPSKHSVPDLDEMGRIRREQYLAAHPKARRARKCPHG